MKTISRDAARAIADEYLRRRFPMQSLTILDEHTNEFDAGWMFHWNSTEYARTRNRMKSLLGNAPLIVSRTGRLSVASTRKRHEHLIEAYRVLGADRFDAGEWREWISHHYPPPEENPRLQLEVKLGDDKVPAAAFMHSLEAALRDVASDTPVPELTLPKRRAGDIGVFGAALVEADLFVDSAAQVDVLCFEAGTEEELGERGGWWMNFGLNIRTSESLFLMILAAGCFAELVGAKVIDEANLLKRGRLLPASEVVAVVAAGRGLPFSEASSVVAASLGVSFEEAQEDVSPA